MAHAHHHEHDKRTFYLEQLCTIATAGLLGGIGVLMWLATRQTDPGRTSRSMLALLLAPKLYWTVVAGGSALLVLVVLRAVTLWWTAPRPATHTHNHDHAHSHVHGHEHHHHDHKGAGAHDHDHDHEHADCADGCGHDHAHGWVPVRYLVLMLPIVLFFLGLPNEGFLDTKSLGARDFDSRMVQVKDRGEAVGLGFTELEQAAYTKEARDYWEGKTGTLKGQMAHSGDEHTFSLVRYRITCCAADAMPAKVLIVCRDSVTDIPSNQWVAVKGQIQFRKRTGHDEYVAVLYVPSRDNIEPVPPDPDYYLQQP
jgi:hypothetical protein